MRGRVTKCFTVNLFFKIQTIIVCMYSLDTVVQHTKNVFVKKSSTRCEKIGL